MKRLTAVSYQKPDGRALRLERQGFADREQPRLEPGVSESYYEADKLLRAAWLTSTWLPQAIGTEKAGEFSQDIPPLYQLHERVVTALARTELATRRQVGWLALTEKPEGRQHVIGVALGKDDVSGTPIQRTYKRLFHPEKVYACISDVAVDPDYQQTGVGTALLEASLQSFDPDQVPTTYVLQPNPSLVAKLGKLGFHETGSHTRMDLFGEELPLEEARLQADSVGDVLERLHAAVPWLQDSERIYS